MQDTLVQFLTLYTPLSNAELEALPIAPTQLLSMTQKQKSEQNINSLSLPEKIQFQLKTVLIGSADVRIYNSTPKVIMN